MIILQAQWPRTLNLLAKRFSDPSFRGATLEAWVFEDAAARSAAETAFRALGITARVRSAYKPLLHAFLEEIDTNQLKSASIALPQHPAATPMRFQLEAYPLAALLPTDVVRFEKGRDGLVHEVTLNYKDGRVAQRQVFAPNRVHLDHLDREALSPCGWIRLLDRDGRILDDAMLHTDLEQAFEAVLGAVRTHDWGTQSPAFETLQILVRVGGIDRCLDIGEERISTREGLAEDLYFSIAEHFYARCGSPPERTLQLGQIIPLIESDDSEMTSVEVCLRPPKPFEWPAHKNEPIDALTAPIHPARLADEMARLGGVPFVANSLQQRPVLGLHVPGAGAGLVITGTRHGNETSGVIGALRAAIALRASGRTNFAVIPLENPDGYALHGRLSAQRPHDHHHAARYSALGDDISYRLHPPWYESSARTEAFAKTAAHLHVDLHGYPAHEWARPLTGYVPRGFEQWTLPKGFFLILEHPPDQRIAAVDFLRLVAAQVATVPGLSALNEDQLKTYRAHAGDPPFESHSGILCEILEVPRGPVPFTLVSEFPDQMIRGESFKLAHEVQCATAVAASTFACVLGSQGDKR
jgi:hypothetical protein